MKPARMWSHDLRYGSSERNNVVANLGLDLVDALDPEVGALLDGFRSVLGYLARFSQGFGGSYLDGKPGAEAVFVAPNAGHLRPRIAGDHLWAPVRCGQRILSPGDDRLSSQRHGDTER